MIETSGPYSPSIESENVIYGFGMPAAEYASMVITVSLDIPHLFHISIPNATVSPESTMPSPLFFELIETLSKIVRPAYLISGAGIFVKAL